MSYIDIEEQLNNITDNLHEKLMQAGAIDETGKTVDRAKFDQVIKNMIDEIIPISRDLELKRYDANSRNIVESRIAWLRKIKNAKSLAWPTNITDGREENSIQKAVHNSPDSYNRGTQLLHRLFGFQRRTPQKLGYEK
ncbi:MAG: hypothetical protein IJL21_01200 [Alphaproteobacteria bacterium]|nr:hypothetical protein [Alphaproteobacteria bacterium]